MSTLTDLPLLGIGTANSGTTGVRNPYNSLQTLPGVSSYNSSRTFTLNGLGGATGFSVPLTETMRIEGQDATSRIFGNYDYTQMSQPSADAIQEIAFQTSNYAAEFGQAGVCGHQHHHEVRHEPVSRQRLRLLCQRRPERRQSVHVSTSTASPERSGRATRRNDFGGTLGGPIYIPKVYNGHNKTFFFFNYEQYLETSLSPLPIPYPRPLI